MYVTLPSFFVFIKKKKYTHTQKRSGLLNFSKYFLISLNSSDSAKNHHTEMNYLKLKLKHFMRGSGELAVRHKSVYDIFKIINFQTNPYFLRFFFTKL